MVVGLIQMKLNLKLKIPTVGLKEIILEIIYKDQRNYAVH